MEIHREHCETCKVSAIASMETAEQMHARMIVPSQTLRVFA